VLSGTQPTTATESRRPTSAVSFGPLELLKLLTQLQAGEEVDSEDRVKTAQAATNVVVEHTEVASGRLR